MSGIPGMSWTIRVALELALSWRMKMIFCTIQPLPFEVDYSQHIQLQFLKSFPKDDTSKRTKIEYWYGYYLLTNFPNNFIFQTYPQRPCNQHPLRLTRIPTTSMLVIISKGWQHPTNWNWYWNGYYLFTDFPTKYSVFTSLTTLGKRKTASCKLLETEKSILNNECRGQGEQVAAAQPNMFLLNNHSFDMNKNPFHEILSL